LRGSARSVALGRISRRAPSLFGRCLRLARPDLDWPWLAPRQRRSRQRRTRYLL